MADTWTFLVLIHSSKGALKGFNARSTPCMREERFTKSAYFSLILGRHKSPQVRSQDQFNELLSCCRMVRQQAFLKLWKRDALPIPLYQLLSQEILWRRSPGHFGVKVRSLELCMLDFIHSHGSMEAWKQLASLAH